MNEKIVRLSKQGGLPADRDASAAEHGQKVLSQHLLKLRHISLTSNTARAPAPFLASKSLKTFDILRILDEIRSENETGE